MPSLGLAEQSSSPQGTMHVMDSPPLRLGLRVTEALVTGATVAALALWVTWQTGREMPTVRVPQTRTQWILRDSVVAIEAHRRKTGFYPVRLSEVDFARTRVEGHVDGDVILDGWKRPLQYSVEGSSVVLTSLGRDGVPGGIGTDFDLSSRNLNPVEALPTFGQFLSDRSLNTAGMLPMCGLSGVFAFLAALWGTLWNAASLVENRKWTASRAILRYALTTLAATIVGTILALLHQPSGH